MLTGIYSGASALENFTKQQEVIASNLAHVSTPGYRRQLLSFQENLKQVETGAVAAPGAGIRDLATDFTPGTKEHTGRPLDLSLTGDGFFVFQGEQGELYSRSGILFRSPQGTLVNSDGLPVMGQGGPIQVPRDVNDENIIIDAEGRISAGETQVGRLRLVTFDNPQQLGTASQIYFTRGNAVAQDAANVSVLQGSRELSNSQPVSELIGLIVGTRSFESAQRAIRAISDAVQESIRA